LIISGTSPQCRPKITHTCHSAPIAAPASQGAKRWPDSRGQPWLSQVASGPIARKVSGTITAMQISG
jgi:hypothetical protein